eukprot:CCRYP_019067-RB/>CCRYP_019067-RB protein AED:0.41 eAED:0.41 QI:57/1/0.5/1/0/0/2/88/52
MLPTTIGSGGYILGVSFHELTIFCTIILTTRPFFQLVSYRCTGEIAETQSTD